MTELETIAKMHSMMKALEEAKINPRFKELCMHIAIHTSELSEILHVDGSDDFYAGGIAGFAAVYGQLLLNEH